MHQYPLSCHVWLKEDEGKAWTWLMSGWLDMWLKDKIGWQLHYSFTWGREIERQWQGKLLNRLSLDDAAVICFGGRESAPVYKLSSSSDWPDQLFRGLKRERMENQNREAWGGGTWMSMKEWTWHKGHSDMCQHPPESTQSGRVSKCRQVALACWFCRQPPWRWYDEPTNQTAMVAKMKTMYKSTWTTTYWGTFSYICL